MCPLPASTAPGTLSLSLMQLFAVWRKLYLSSRVQAQPLTRHLSESILASKCGLTMPCSMMPHGRVAFLAGLRTTADMARMGAITIEFATTPNTSASALPRPHCRSVAETSSDPSSPHSTI